MKPTIRFRPKARDEIRAALGWWEENRPLAPLMLNDELRSGLTRFRTGFASTTPAAINADGTISIRSVLLGRTRYRLYAFLHEESEVIEILSLWHTNRGSDPDID